MNRLSPLIARTVGAYAPSPVYDAPGAYIERRDPLEDLKLFATGWVGGLVFFGTLFS